LDDAAKANVISLEEFLETERHKLGPNLTPVTPETFAKWKQTRLDQKVAADEALKKAKDAQAAAGKSSGMSGRDLVSLEYFARQCRPSSGALQFQYNPEWFEDDEEDDDDWDISQYRKEKEDEDLAAEEARIAGLSVDDADG
jgi:hypothetical protein